MTRDIRIDSIKGFLIILVVIGHVLESYLQHTHNLIPYLLIYSFHMPLFILVSGYLFKPEQTIGKFWIGTLKLAETFLIFQFIQCFMIWAGNGFCNFDPMNFIRPQWTLWYIVSLMAWRIATYFLNKHIAPTNKNKAIILIAVVLLALFVGFIPMGNEFSFQRTFVYYPVFVIGSWLKDKPLALKLQNINVIKRGGNREPRIIDNHIPYHRHRISALSDVWKPDLHHINLPFLPSR